MYYYNFQRFSFLILQLEFQIFSYHIFNIIKMCPKILKTHLPNFWVSYSTDEQEVQACINIWR